MRHTFWKQSGSQCRPEQVAEHRAASQARGMSTTRHKLLWLAEPCPGAAGPPGQQRGTVCRCQPPHPSPPCPRSRQHSPEWRHSMSLCAHSPARQVVSCSAGSSELAQQCHQLAARKPAPGCLPQQSSLALCLPHAAALLLLECTQRRAAPRQLSIPSAGMLACAWHHTERQLRSRGH